MNAYKGLLDSLPADQKRLAKEQLSLLKGLSHPHLCRIDDVTDSNGPLSVACEFLGDNLNNCLRIQSRTWSHEELALHFLGLVAALGKTQEMVGTTQGFAHGRLSLEALYLDYPGNKVKIVGFGGFSGYPEDSTQACSRLLPPYHSPEIRQRVHFNAYKADMWALFSRTRDY
jgi:serine/threonine protein kinase